jgi:hypothetical protein
MIIELGVAHDKHLGTTIVGLVKNADDSVTVVHQSFHKEGDSSTRINLENHIAAYPEGLAQAICRLVRDRGYIISCYDVIDFLKMHSATIEQVNKFEAAQD